MRGNTPKNNLEVEKMGLLELFLVAVGLSMDAFAVAVCKGLALRKVNWPW